MEKFKINDKAIVIANGSCHGIREGTIVTIQRIDIDENKRPQIRVKEYTSWFFDTDIELLKPPINKNPGKFIITDPQFIMNKTQYKEIQYNHENFKEPNYENLNFPIKSKHNETKEPIIIHYIESTPYGPGKYENEKSEKLTTKSGYICIAENNLEWPNESYGIKFDTLLTAQNEFQNILNKF